MGHHSVAQPADQGGLDLHDLDRPHPGVVEHRPQGEPQAQAADQHRPGLGHRPQRGRRHRLLAGGLGGVHHEHAVGPQLEHPFAPGIDPLAQHQLAALGLRSGHLVHRDQPRLNRSTGSSVSRVWEV